MSLRDAVHAKVIELGKHVVRMCTEAGSGHPSSALSLGHLVVELMYRHMRYDPADPWNPNSDRLVLSEGHSVPIVYAAYADLGGVVGTSPDQARTVSPDELLRLRELDSVLDGHPNPAEGFPFFDAATGSLGQGLSVAAGLALAARQQGIKKRIFVLIGDGESREGQIWEAADFIVDNKLNKVVAIFNCNGQGQADYVSPQQSADTLAKKLRAYGFSVKVIDGHDVDQIDAALSSAGKTRNPLAIVAKTVKGWGVEALKDKGNHGKPLPADKLEQAAADLESMYGKLGVSPGADGMFPPKPQRKRKAHPSGPINLPSFAEAMADAGLSGAVEKGALATRRAYGAALLALGKADARVVALDGDVSNSTFANFFAKQFADRFFECKIAEQNMISTAAGLAAAGMIPFASSFAKFLSRGYDQVEMASITRANIKLVGSHAGVTLAADGPSQMGLVDVAFFRSFAGVDTGDGRAACVLFQPADAVAAYRCTELMANYDGMCYLRTHRPDVPLLYGENESFEIGGCKQLAEGDAVTIVASGCMVHEARKALDRLAGDGVRCSLIDAYCFPITCNLILQSAAATGGRILTVEDNYGGGLGSEVAEMAAASGEGFTVKTMTCRRIPKSARTPDQVLAYVGLDVAEIARQARAML
ncbi:MAG TPA: transketolase [Phycisphaerae bacterium]|nr:transketolase [Phycisphaerae bacterium]